MTALTEIKGVGKAVRCDACGLKDHRPEPARFVWHHILPQVCGGKSTPENTVMTCDSGHYAIHDLLWRMVNDPASLRGRRYTRRHWVLARRGRAWADQAGTTGRIPREA